MLFAARISFEEPVHHSWFPSPGLASQLVTPSHFQVDGELFLCSCALNCPQLSFKILSYFLHFAALILASCSACQELLPPGLSPGILKGVFLINVLGAFRAFPSHFLVVSPSPAPCTPHSYSALRWAQSSCPLSTACGASQVPLAVRDVYAEHGTEAVTFLVSAVPGNDVADSFPWLGFCSRARPTLQCLAPQQGPGQAGSAVLLALPPLAHWGTWHQPRPSQWLILAGPSAAPMDAPSLSKIMAWSWRDS